MYQSHGRRRRRSLVYFGKPNSGGAPSRRGAASAQLLSVHISRVFEAPHAIDATITRSMLNSYNLLLRIGQLVEEPLLVLRLGLVVSVVLL